MNILETLGQPVFLLVIWILFLIWSLLYWILKLKTDSLKFLYWDFVFAILLTFTFLTTISFFAVEIDYKKFWLLIPPIIFGLFDLAENTVLTLKFPAKPPIVRFLKIGKWLFYAVSNLVFVRLAVKYILK